MPTSTKNTDPKKTLVNAISRVYSNITLKCRKEPYKSDGTCISFESKMKQVYDSVCIFSRRTRQYHFDYEMTKLDETRPLIREAFALWQQIPDSIRVGLGVAASVQLMSVTANSL